MPVVLGQFDFLEFYLSVFHSFDDLVVVVDVGAARCTLLFEERGLDFEFLYLVEIVQFLFSLPISLRLRLRQLGHPLLHILLSLHKLLLLTLLQVLNCLFDFFYSLIVRLL